MAIHKVTANQNIWDVAIQLYGTIEGVFDLLISNPSLNMTSDLVPGMELQYHDYFVINSDIVSSLKDNNLTPSNGERHVYYKDTSAPLLIICDIPATQTFSEIIATGTGWMKKLVVDWGDDTDLEYIKLTPSSPTRITHYFNTTVDKRRIKIYGDGKNLMLGTLDMSNLGGDMYVIQPIAVEEFISKANRNSLKGLFLFDDTARVDLQGMAISDLSPVLNMHLQELNLLQVQYTNIDVLDDYLEGLVTYHNDRRNCVVYLDTEPSERGMSAIQTIINEPAWNMAGKWKFIINDKVYMQD